MRTPTTIYSDVFVPLHGAHQGDNAAVALTPVEAFFAAPLPEALVNEGFANVEMPGRCEVMGVQPLTIIDGAHNTPGADVCASVFFQDFNPDGRRILVMGTLRNPTEMLAALRVDTKNTHGTGCTLSSAIAAGLAKGESLEQSVRAAKTYVSAAIAAADKLGVGHGHGPVHHFHRFD